MLVPSVVLLVVVLAAVLAWQAGALNRYICDGACGLSTVVAPEGLVSLPVGGAAAVSTPDAGPLDAASVQAAVEGALDDPDLGGHVGFVALDAATGEHVVSRGADALIPASTAKLLTGFAALTHIDPQSRFVTKVVREGDRLVLVGGGDPYLVRELPERRSYAVRADLETLADRTAAALAATSTTSVGLDWDASLFEGPAVSPAWEPGYVSSGVVSPVSALWVDEGRLDGGGRSTDPARDATSAFADALEQRGIDVAGDSSSVDVSPSAQELARVTGATVAQAVEALVMSSDNDAAEVMLRHAAIGASQPATFDGGVTATLEALDDAGVPVDGLELHDGSGLSRHNRVSAATLARLLLASDAEPRAAGLLDDLPVAGFSGSLADRFASSTEAFGLARAKTGTLTGVHGLAGVVTDAGGRPVVFALLADRTEAVTPAATQAALDRVVAAVASCACGA